MGTTGGVPTFLSVNSMGKRKNEHEQPQRRFSKALFGEFIMRHFRFMPTAELARLLGLKPRQISDFIYRNNYDDRASKDAAERSQVASENGRKGGRPKKKNMK